MTRSKLLIGLTILAIASLFFALLSGSFTEGPGEVLASLIGAGDSATRDVVMKLRLPRALTAFAPSHEKTPPSCGVFCCAPGTARSALIGAVPGGGASG